MNSFNPSILKLAREQLGVSQKELALLLKVQQSAICKYELGTISPSEDVIERMSSLFQYPRDFFYQDNFIADSGLVYHRKRASLSAKDRAKIEAEVRLRTIDVYQLLKKGSIKSNLLLREGDESPEAMAQSLRKFWNVDNGPIENVTELFEKNNIVILSFPFELSELDGFTLNLGEIVCIALNDDIVFSPDRRRFTLCHELAHSVLHRNTFPCKKTEKEADAFAAEFLAPEEQIKKEFVTPLTLDELKQLKTRWKISMASLVVRAHSLEVISDAVYRHTMIYLSSCGFRKKEPECGLSFEYPSLLLEKIKSLFRETPDVLAQLKLSKERFMQRYSQLGGLIDMTVGKA